MVSEWTHGGFTVRGEGKRAEDRGLTNPPLWSRGRTRQKKGREAGLGPLRGAQPHHSRALLTRWRKGPFPSAAGVSSPGLPREHGEQWVLRLCHRRDQWAEGETSGGTCSRAEQLLPQGTPHWAEAALWLTHNALPLSVRDAPSTAGAVTRCLTLKFTSSHLVPSYLSPPAQAWVCQGGVWEPHR